MKNAGVAQREDQSLVTQVAQAGLDLKPSLPQPPLMAQSNKLFIYFGFSV